MSDYTSTNRFHALVSFKRAVKVSELLRAVRVANCTGISLWGANNVWRQADIICLMLTFMMLINLNATSLLSTVKRIRLRGLILRCTPVMFIKNIIIAMNICLVHYCIASFPDFFENVWKIFHTNCFIS